VISSAALPQVFNDYDGHKKPLGAGYSIGAHQE